MPKVAEFNTTTSSGRIFSRGLGPMATTGPVKYPDYIVIVMTTV